MEKFQLKFTYALKITYFRCKNNAQDIGTQCNLNIFAAGVSKLVFRIWNENKKLKYSGFVSERQEKICITYKGKRRQFAGCVYLRRRKRHLIFDVLY